MSRHHYFGSRAISRRCYCGAYLDSSCYTICVRCTGRRARPNPPLPPCEEAAPLPRIRHVALRDDGSVAAPYGTDAATWLRRLAALGE